MPDEVVSDNGPQFSSHEFEKSKQEYGFKHITSSPHGQWSRAMVNVRKLSE